MILNMIFMIGFQLSMSALGKMEWDQGYTCPPYCGVDHKHIGLDLQSSSKEGVSENTKSLFLIDLGKKKKY